MSSRDGCRDRGRHYEYTRIRPSVWVSGVVEVYDVVGGVEIVTGADVEVKE